MPNNPGGNEFMCVHGQHADCQLCMFDLVWAAQEALDKGLLEYRIGPEESIKGFLESIAEQNYPNA